MFVVGVIVMLFTVVYDSLPTVHRKELLFSEKQISDSYNFRSHPVAVVNKPLSPIRK